MADQKPSEELKEVKEKLKEKEAVIKEQKKLTQTATSIAKTAAMNLKNETRKQTATAIIAAFGFLIALVWKDAIKSYIDHVVAQISFQGPQFLLTLYTTVITTIIAVIGIVIVTKWNTPKDSKTKKIN